MWIDPNLDPWFVTLVYPLDDEREKNQLTFSNFSGKQFQASLSQSLYITILFAPGSIFEAPLWIVAPFVSTFLILFDFQFLI